MKKLILTLLFSVKLIYCQSSIKYPDGEVIEGFESLQDWTFSGAGVYELLDSINYTEGSYSLKLGTIVNERASMKKNISLDFNKYETFSVDLYAPDFFRDFDRNIRIEISSDTNFYKYLRANIYAGDRLFVGWNRILLSKSDFKDGSENWSNSMKRLRFTEWVSNNNNLNSGFITWDNFRGHYKKSTAIAIITFDDNWKSNLDIGKPILDSLGFKAVEYVIGSIASQTQPNRLHWNDYDFLYQEGWDICNHTYKHDTLTHLNIDQLNSAINGMRDTLIAHGYTRSSDYFAYPYGYFNSTVIDKVKEKHKLARCTTDWQYLSHPTGIGNDYYLLRKHSELETYEQACSNIDKAIERGQLLVFLFHDISSYSQKFSAIMHYLKAKQDKEMIRVMTMSEYWEYMKNPSNINYVNDNSNEIIRLTQNYPNPFNTCTNISYELSKGSVVIIKIFNILGQEVETIYRGYNTAGKHSVTFEGSNHPSGIYLYRLEINNIKLTKKLILIK